MRRWELYSFSVYLLDILTDFSSGFCWSTISFYGKIPRCEFSISKMKYIYMRMVVECLIVAKGQLLLELWVSELGVLDQRSNKEASS